MTTFKTALVPGANIDVMQLVKQELTDPEYEKTWKNEGDEEEDDDEEAMYHCGLCGFKDENLHVVEQHAAKKHELGACYFCATCDVTFKSNAALTKHEKKEHSSKSDTEKHLSCDQCQNVFASKSGLTRHKKSKHPPREDTVEVKDNTCEYCGETFESRSGMMRHRKTKHAAEIERTDQVEDSDQDIDNEMNMVVEDGDYECETPEEDDGGDWRRPARRKSKRKRRATRKILSEDYEEVAPTRRSKFEHVCTECGKAYKKPQGLREHMASHSGERNVSCTLCDATFAWSSSLKVHMRTIHNSEKEFKCPWPECDREFNLAYYLKLHSRQHTGERPFKCDQCGKTYTQASHLKEHVLTHQPIKPYTCDHCGKGFFRAERLKTHLRSHTGERPFSCDHPNCDKSFMSSGDLLKHKWIHEKGDIKHQCPVCDKGFHRRADLTRHLHIHEGIPSEDSGGFDEKMKNVQRKRVVCDTCGKSLSSNSALTVHRRIHTGERPYLCSECGKGFLSTSHLKVHMGIHLVEKPYKCDKCPKSFMRPGRLSEHKTLHSGQHNYQCDVCGKGFRWHLSYRLHKKHHDDPKPYKCNICNQTFAWPMSYHTHMKKHTGQANYSCRKCNQKFTVRRSLINHLQKPCSAANVNYTCKVCGAILRYYATMKKHCEQFHKREITFDEEVTRATIWRCRVCKKVLPSRTLLVKHKRESDECRKGREYHCRCCQMGFANRGLLNSHYKETACGTSQLLKEGNFQCNQCDKSYTTRGSLNKHTKKHKNASALTEEKLPEVGIDSVNRLAEMTKEMEERNKKDGPEIEFSVFEYSMIRTLAKRSYLLGIDGIRRWLCGLCTTEFTDPVKLREHVGVHINEKKVLCTVCGKYVLARWKREHQLRHERKFICHICSRPLSCSKTLKDHIRAHSGTKSFQCQYCTKSFTWPSGLRYHLKTHTNDRRHQCPICSKKFIAPYNLKTHMNASHPGKYTEHLNAMKAAESGGKTGAGPNDSPLTQSALSLVSGATSHQTSERLFSRPLPSEGDLSLYNLEQEGSATMRRPHDPTVTDTNDSTNSDIHAARSVEQLIVLNNTTMKVYNKEDTAFARCDPQI